MLVLLIIANVFGAGMIVPQVLRLHRHRSLDGVSSTWIGVGIALNFWWTLYALGAGVLGVLPVSIAAVFLYVAMAAQVTRIHRPQLPRIAASASGVGLVPFTALLLGGWNASGLALGLCYAVMFAPAALTAVRSDELDGISAPTWIMAAIEAVIWVIYGASLNDPMLIIGGSGGAIASAVILFRLFTGRSGTARSSDLAGENGPPRTEISESVRCDATGSPA